ncbi:helix-turn-helix transcriptional regulator [uncultured Lactobacillus sp.]|uniref:helix-turn-helix domain-containing protein n=1 Tax=uncultured Lactobacillus sp. TaxID=153152 RepID=UPI0028039FDD|nr:helix-turn-helix transcriptional regulator [uncultured Lactobacillus sp.]
MSIGEALKQLRLHAGLTQQQMAGGIISESFYSKVERDVHEIDANLLIELLTSHHFDVVSFFTNVANQNTKTEPNFELMNQISFAQNRKDLQALDKIKAEIEESQTKPSFWLRFRLDNAYAWVLHSNKMISPEMKKKVKSIIMDENWNRTAYHYLSQAVIFLDIDEAYQMVDSAFRAYEKKPQSDTFTLQFVAIIAVNFLNCCYHQEEKVDKKYIDRAVGFLRELPKDGVIGINSVLGTYYEAVFNDDKEMADMIVKVLKASGYLSLIEDAFDKN